MSESAQLPQVDRRSKLSVGEFNQEYRSLGRPVVITDAIEDWPALSSWTFDYFKSHYGATLVNVHRYEGGKYKTDHVEQMVLADFIDRLLANNWSSCPYYIRDDWRFLRQHQELLADYKTPQYFFDWFTFFPRFMRLIYPRIFIGPQGAVTPLHVDIWGTHAWLAQLVGRKRWLLFPPDQEKFLYNYDVDPDRPDFNRFPLFRQARPLECIIGPGDLIFVPGGWAHQVTSLDPTISLTANYMGPGCFGPSLTNAIREQLLKRMRNVVIQGAKKRGAKTIPGSEMESKI